MTRFRLHLTAYRYRDRKWVDRHFSGPAPHLREAAIRAKRAAVDVGWLDDPREVQEIVDITDY